MKKLFLAVSSMIVTGFLMKSYRKLREEPESKEEVHRRIKAAHEAHLEIERRRAAARPVIAQCDDMAMAPGRFA